jgi:hypothetical protein
MGDLPDFTNAIYLAWCYGVTLLWILALLGALGFLS